MATQRGEPGKESQADVPEVPASPLNRLAVWITTRVGSMGFFLTIL